MDLLLAIMALFVGTVAAVLALMVRRELEVARKATALATAAADQALASARRDIEGLRHELSELRASAESPPPPPLPKARRGALDDLREQLKAAQRTTDAGEEGDQGD